MKKYLLIAELVITVSISAFAQTAEDSIRITGLMNQLPKLTGNAHVDCLNDIAREYQYLGVQKMDSVYRYATNANKEAKESNYQYGLASSLMKLGGYEVFAKKDLIKAAQYFKEAIAIAEKINKPGLLGWAYLGYGEVDIRKNEPKIKTWKKALSYFQKAGDIEGEAEVSNWLCSEYSAKGNYEEGFQFCQKSVELSPKKRTHNISWGHFLVNFSLMNMSYLYMAAGDYETALSTLRKGKEYAIKNNYYWDLTDIIGDLFIRMRKADSALYYTQKHYEVQPDRPIVKIRLAEAYLLTGNYRGALQLFQEAVDTVRKRPFNKSLSRSLIGLAKSHEGIKNYSLALKYAQEGFGLAKKRNEWELTLDGYLLLSRLYNKVGKYNLAYSNLLNYTTLKDSVINRQFLWRLNNYKSAAINAKKESDMAILAKDNKIKSQQLKQQEFVRNSLIGGLILSFLLGFFIFRSLSLKRKNEKLRRVQVENDMKVQQLENDKRHAELQQKASELEMQALRAQMNPHFIFNCLSSINRFILKNEIEIASDYLTRFSRLIRMVLIHSQKSLISLEDELEILKLYLDMERLRFKDAFDYNIIFTNRIDAGAVYVPPLLLQPFCENAIWHGLMHKEEKGHLNISLSMENKVLHCCISDDGIGREKASQFKSKSAEKDKSLGLKITTERLALLNGENAISTFYEINDILDEDENVIGTKVDLKIKYRESVEEYI